MEVIGTWTLEKIASAVKNNLEAGLKTTAAYVFSLEQLEHEIIAERNAIIKKLEQQKILEPGEMVQEINCIELDCENLGLCCNLDTKTPTLHFKVPVFNHIAHVGVVNYNKPFKVYQNDGDLYNGYRDKRLVSRPYVRFRLHEGEMHGFVFNPPTHNLKYISIRAVFENPIEVNKFSCCNFSKSKDRFPAPDYIINEIINNITSRWASWYYRFQGSKPNSQTPVI